MWFTILVCLSITNVFATIESESHDPMNELMDPNALPLILSPQYRPDKNLILHLPQCIIASAREGNLEIFTMIVTRDHLVDWTTGISNHPLNYAHHLLDLRTLSDINRILLKPPEFALNSDQFNSFDNSILEKWTYFLISNRNHFYHDKKNIIADICGSLLTYYTWTSDTSHFDLVLETMKSKEIPFNSRITSLFTIKKNRPDMLKKLLKSGVLNSIMFDEMMLYICKRGDVNYFQILKMYGKTYLEAKKSFIAEWTVLVFHKYESLFDEFANLKMITATTTPQTLDHLRTILHSDSINRMDRLIKSLHGNVLHRLVKMGAKTLDYELVKLLLGFDGDHELLKAAVRTSAGFSQDLDLIHYYNSMEPVLMETEMAVNVFTEACLVDNQRVIDYFFIKNPKSKSDVWGQHLYSATLEGVKSALKTSNLEMIEKFMAKYPVYKFLLDLFKEMKTLDYLPTRIVVGLFDKSLVNIETLDHHIDLKGYFMKLAKSDILSFQLIVNHPETRKLIGKEQVGQLLNHCFDNNESEELLSFILSEKYLFDQIEVSKWNEYERKASSTPHLREMFFYSAENMLSLHKEHLTSMHLHP